MIALQTATVSSRDDRQAIETEMQRILFRLEDGFEKIARAAANGDDVGRWEDIWIELLSEYEHLHDQLAA